uniref:Uncharacterized protein n=1 Tax=Oryza punctata TaxID=4537 RepID=A0A0E0L4T7_ORYPU
MTKTFPVFPIPRLQDRTGGQPTTGGIAPLHQIKALLLSDGGGVMVTHAAMLLLLSYYYYYTAFWDHWKHSNNVHGYE